MSSAKERKLKSVKVVLAVCQFILCVTFLGLTIQKSIRIIQVEDALKRAHQKRENPYLRTYTEGKLGDEFNFLVSLKHLKLWFEFKN